MNKIFYLLMALPLFIASCSHDDIAVSEETVEVSFFAKVPQGMGSRTVSTLSVDRVYCAVFKNGNEISTLREEIIIEEGKDIVFSPRLIKGSTYDVVFWASRNGEYNVSDMRSITRNTDINGEEASFDAFTAHTTVTVNNSTQIKSITLERPLAQLNIGVTPEDWSVVENQFNMTPTNITISLSGKDTFDAFTGWAIGEDKTIFHHLSISGSEFTCEEKIYKNIAQCFVLPESEKENFNIKFTLYDQDKVICEDIAINNVPFQTNYKTNIVGRLLTGTVTYNISLQEGFNEE